MKPQVTTVVFIHIITAPAAPVPWNINFYLICNAITRRQKLHFWRTYRVVWNALRSQGLPDGAECVLVQKKFLVLLSTGAWRETSWRLLVSLSEMNWVNDLKLCIKGSKIEKFLDNCQWSRRSILFYSSFCVRFLNLFQERKKGNRISWLFTSYLVIIKAMKDWE